MKTLQTELDAVKDRASNEQPDFYGNLKKDKKFKKLENKLGIVDAYLSTHGNQLFEEWLKTYPNYVQKAPKTVEEVKKELQQSIEGFGFDALKDADDLYDYLYMAKFYALDLNDDYEQMIDDYEDNMDIDGSTWFGAGGKKKRKAKRAERKQVRQQRKVVRKQKKATKKVLRAQKKSGEITKKQFRAGKKEARKTKRAGIKELGGSGLTRGFRAFKKVGLAPVRAAFLTIIHLNVWDMAAKLKKLKDASTTNEQAKKAWEKTVNHVWKNRFAGKPKSFINQINKGASKKPIIIRFRKKKKGVDGSTIYEAYEAGGGEIYLNQGGPAEAATAAVAATPLIVQVGAILASVAAIVGVLPIDKQSKDELNESAQEGVTDDEGNKVQTDAEGNIIVTDAKGNVTKVDAKGNIEGKMTTLFTPKNIGIGVAVIVLLGGGLYAISQAMKGGKKQ